MVSLEKLYQSTREGLDIILHYFPEARESVGNEKRAFRAFRPSEKTPSAHLYAPRPGAKTPCWRVCDYGDDTEALSPIDIVMRQEGVRFPEAVMKMAALFGVSDELNREVNRPIIKTRPATPDEPREGRVFALLERIPESVLPVLGPKVEREHAEALGWHAAEWVGYVKDGQVKQEYATEHYPILMRRCRVPEAEGKPEAVFYKIYKPLNPEKQYRFSYTPDGIKPRAYVNGLEELRELHRAFNARREQEFFADPANDGRPFSPQKLDEAFICSGERDALCCKSMGFPPLWFNSESYKMSETEYREITKLVRTLYNIPDLDDTGRRKGTELALRFPDIHTIWLPEWLTTWRDHRGRPRKDLRDWMELRHEKRDFEGLMNIATPAKFWTEYYNPKRERNEYQILPSCLFAFLALHGFHRLADPQSRDARYVRLQGNVVSEVSARDIRDFVRTWAQDQCLPMALRDVIATSPRINAPQSLEALPTIDPDFTSYTPTSQFFYLQNKTLEVTPTDIIDHGTATPASRCVWAENVIPHRFQPLPPMFDIHRTTDADGRPIFDIDVRSTTSRTFATLINTSRLHWREELETRFQGDRQAAEAYHRANPFRIDGEGLTPHQIHEQKQALLNKIFVIGFLLHRYKAPSRAWAPFAMDYKIGDTGQCNGRSGKSFLFFALANFMKYVKLSGRDKNLLANKHVFEEIDTHTDFVFVDDLDRYFEMGVFYDIITSGITVNRKNQAIYTIKYRDAPKFAFSSNYVPTEFSASTAARMIYMVYSDYYHERTDESDYLQTRSIRTDHNMELFGDDYPEADWNADINFFLQCTRFYLSICQENIKIQAPMHNILLRRDRADMGDSFEDWANIYFAPDATEHLDTLIPRSAAFQDFLTATGGATRNIKMPTFTKKLQAFARFAPHIHTLNPPELRNSQNRISRRIEGRLEDMIYLRTTEAERIGAELNATIDQPTPPPAFLPDERLL